MPTDLLTPTEAGAILGKSARTVHRLILSGTLSAAQKLPGPNGAWLLHRGDVEALAASQGTVAGSHLTPTEPTEAAS